MMEQLGLNRPLFEQYISYIKGVLHGDLGNSFRNNEPVLKEFFTLFPATVELAFFALLWSLIFGIILGVIAAVKKKVGFHTL